MQQRFKFCLISILSMICLIIFSTSAFAMTVSVDGTNNAPNTNTFTLIATTAVSWQCDFAEAPSNEFNSSFTITDSMGNTIVSRNYTDSGSFTEPAGTYTITASGGVYHTPAGPAYGTVTGSVTYTLNDTTPPTVTITSPAANAQLGGTVEIQATASDNIEVVKVEFYIDNSLLQTITTSPYQCSWDTTWYGGSHTIKAIAYDPANNTASYSVPVTLDHEAYSVTASNGSPQSVSFCPPLNVMVNYQYNLTTGINGLSYSYFTITANNSDVVNYSSGSGTGSFLAQAGITYTMKVYGGSAGNEGTVVYGSGSGAVNYLLEDRIPPTVSITSPANGSFVKGSITVEINAHDENEVAGTALYLDGNLLSSDVINTTAYPDGSHTLQAKATDGAGNVGTSSLINFTIDNQPPSLTITSPAANARIGGTVTIQATATDNTGVANVELYIDGSLVNTFTSPPYQYSWNTTWISGSHTIEMIASDQAGNTATQTETVTMDHIVRNLTSNNGSIAQANFTLIGPTTVYWNCTYGIGAPSCSTSPYFNIVNSNGTAVLSQTATGSGSFTGQAGTYTIYVYGGDYNLAPSGMIYGTMAGSISAAVNDTVNPVVAITSPAANAVLDGTVVIQADATDNTEIVKVEFYIDNNLFQTVTTPPYQYSWNTTWYGGPHTIKVIAYDPADNTASASIPINLDHQAAGVSSTNGVAQSISFCPPLCGMVNYQYDLTHAITTGNCGSFTITTGGGTVVSYLTGSGTGSFTAQAGTTYTMTVNGGSLSTPDGMVYGIATASVNYLTDDIIPPTVAITSPAANAILGGTVVIQAKPRTMWPLPELDFILITLYCKQSLPHLINIRGIPLGTAVPIPSKRLLMTPPAIPPVLRYPSVWIMRLTVLRPIMASRSRSHSAHR